MIWQPHRAVLDASRPTAVNLSWATARVMTLARQLALTGPSASLRAGVDDMRSTILAEAERIADEDVAINRRMGAFGAAIVPQAVAPQAVAPQGWSEGWSEAANILTHCNAGSLATVDYGTTLGVVRGHRGGQEGSRVGGRDVAAAPGRAADRLGADARWHPDDPDRR